MLSTMQKDMLFFFLSEVHESLSTNYPSHFFSSTNSFSRINLDTQEEFKIDDLNCLEDFEDAIKLISIFTTIYRLTEEFNNGAKYQKCNVDYVKVLEKAITVFRKYFFEQRGDSSYEPEIYYFFNLWVNNCITSNEHLRSLNLLKDAIVRIIENPLTREIFTFDFVINVNSFWKNLLIAGFNFDKDKDLLSRIQTSLNELNESNCLGLEYPLPLSKVESKLLWLKGSRDDNDYGISLLFKKKEKPKYSFFLFKDKLFVNGRRGRNLQLFVGNNDKKDSVSFDIIFENKAAFESVMLNEVVSLISVSAVSKDFSSFNDISKSILDFNSAYNNDFYISFDMICIILNECGLMTKENLEIHEKVLLENTSPFNLNEDKSISPNSYLSNNVDAMFHMFKIVDRNVGNHKLDLSDYFLESSINLKHLDVDDLSSEQLDFALKMVKGDNYLSYVFSKLPGIEFYNDLSVLD